MTTTTLWVDYLNIYGYSDIAYKMSEELFFLFFGKKYTQKIYTNNYLKDKKNEWYIIKNNKYEQMIFSHTFLLRFTYIVCNAVTIAAIATRKRGLNLGYDKTVVVLWPSTSQPKLFFGVHYLFQMGNHRNKDSTACNADRPKMRLLHISFLYNQKKNVMK